MKALVVFLATAFLSTASLANGIDDRCPEHVYKQAPVSKLVEGKYLCRKGYGVHYNYTKLTPEYVVEHITDNHLHWDGERTNDFRVDNEIPKEYRANLKDFRDGSSVYDRGHMAPAEDFTYDPDIMSESFLLSNMVPQVKENNRGIWRALEMQIVKYATNVNDLYVITGPIYDNGYSSIGTDHKVAVPQRLFKIIYDEKKNSVTAYIIENKKLNVKDLPKMVTTVAEVERQTGLSFPALKDVTTVLVIGK